MTTSYKVWLLNCAVLHDLLQKNSKWKWTTKHTKGIQTVKALLTSTNTLTHYDRSSGHRCSDISHAPRRQRAYTSCKLTVAEQNYAQIQKEALGIVFGVTVLNGS